MKPRLRTTGKTPAAKFFALAFLCLFLCVTAGSGRAEPPFSGALPIPPQQNAAWTMATQAPLELMDAMSAVFENGMADPRGCEYREITIIIGSVAFGDARETGTRGWLLPGNGEKNRFAIAWNGLVYPVVKIGAPADLKKDLQIAPDSDDERSKDFFLFVPTEWQSVKLPPSRALGAVILLRLGDEETAMRWWSDWRRKDTTRDAIWFVASRWLWARFDRALCAYLRGDDHLALIELRALWEAKPKIEAIIRARGSEPALFGGETSPLRFLWPTPLLIAEIERRAKQKAVPAGKTALLIEELANVRVFRGTGGTINLADSPIVQELIAQGESAVPALLDTVENDNRLTRSVDYYSYNRPDRRVYSVAEAAYAALTAILQNYSFGTNDQLLKPETRAALVKRARAFWAQYKTLGQADRWYFILADDKAGPTQWVQAAQTILRPSDAVFRSGVWVVDPRLPGAKWSFSGEALRSRTTPSISQLMARRVDEISRRALQSANEERYKLMPQAADLALALVQWDEKAALPSLQLCFARNAQLLQNPPADLVKRWNVISQWENRERMFGLVDLNDLCASIMPQLLWQRQQAGDATALSDYWKWLRRPIGAIPLGRFSTPIFEPLVRYRKTPEAARIAWELFADKKSLFNPLFPQQPRFEEEVQRAEDFVQSSLLSLPAFRRLVLHELQDVSVIGTVSAEDGKSFDDLFFELRYAPNYYGRPRSPSRKSISFRRCDIFARALSRVEGAPECRLFWPVEKRDQAVAAARNFLTRFGERIQPTKETGAYETTGVRLVLPRLTRLASADDVARGAAIFTMTSPGEKRVVPMNFPRRARYKTWNVEGTLWQAEETKQDGQWKRYYGFVGRHQILKATAEEIELLE